MTTRSKAPMNDAIDRPPTIPQMTDHIEKTLEELSPEERGALAAACVENAPLPPKPKRPRDPELVAMEQLIKVFDAMPEYCKQRVLSWLQAKYGCGPQGERPHQAIPSFREGVAQ